MPGIVLASFVAVLDVLAVALGWHQIRWVTKPLAALILAVVAWRAGGRSRRILAGGLVLAAAGDEVLLNSSDNAFLLGMLAFAGMQIAYVAAFLSAGATWKPKTRWAWMSVLYAAIAVLLFSRLLPNAGTMAVPLVVYAVLLFAMASFALQMPRATAAGGAIFMCSDMILAITKVQGPILDPTTAEVVVMATYFVAQLLVVYGMTRERERPTEA